MARRKIAGAAALVTGASSGIGREIAYLLARDGARIVVSARRAEKLKQLVNEIHAAGGYARDVPGDVTDPEFRNRLLEVTDSEFGKLDVLVNNAAITAVGRFADTCPENMRRVMEVNFFAPVELTRNAIRSLRRGTKPIIVNIASVLAHRAVPNLIEYCSSKFALHGFSDALRAELAPEGIDVLIVSPSTTRTEIFDQAIGDQNKIPRWSAVGAVAPARVARQTIRAIRSGRHEVILSPGGKLLVWADRLSPPIVNRLVARFNREPSSDEA